MRFSLNREQRELMVAHGLSSLALTADLSLLLAIYLFASPPFFWIMLVWIILDQLTYVSMITNRRDRRVRP